MADPVSPLLADRGREGCDGGREIAFTRGGTYLVMEGPQFSTRAESNLYRSWGCDVIGMTNMPEAKLAREAEICYATVAMVTDYDCWHAEHAEVDVAAVIKVLHANVDKAHRLIERLAREFPRQHPPCPIGSDRAPRRRHHHPARRARSGPHRQARRRGRPRAEAGLTWGQLCGPSLDARSARAGHAGRASCRLVNRISWPGAGPGHARACRGPGT